MGCRAFRVRKEGRIVTVFSMTGFGHGGAMSDDCRIEADITTVNRKQLDLNIQLPRVLQSLEPRVTDIVASRLVRGRVAVNITLDRKDGEVTSIRIREDLVRSVVKQCEQAASRTGIASGVTMADLIRIPGLMIMEERAVDPETVAPVVERAVRAALKECEAMRKREGETLGADLGRRVDALRKHVAYIRRRAPRLVREYRQQLRERIERLREDVDIPADRLEREVILYADRSDITEELTRLLSHLEQADTLLSKGKAVGRSLDFLAQELLREINTVGSKSSDAAVAQRVVTFKSELERFREQVQNIE